MKQFVKMLVCGAAFAALSACGGGGSDVAFIPAPPPAPKPPPPPPAPPPPEAADVHIFDNPATQEFAVMSDPSNPGFRLRYDSAAQAYEVATDDYDWTPLLPGDQANTYDVQSRGSWVSISQTYEYSALAYWDWWDIAIGSVTAEGQVPTSGSADYQGIIQGTSDTWDNGPFPSPNPVEGTIALSFDFGAGTLSGAMRPTLYVRDGSTPASYDLGVLAFKDTVFSPGATNFSGAFDTGVAGPNSFSGRFTGPNAEELIGTWAIPFVWDQDQQLHSAAGAMIGKR